MGVIKILMDAVLVRCLFYTLCTLFSKLCWLDNYPNGQWWGLSVVHTWIGFPLFLTIGRCRWIYRLSLIHI